MNGVFPLEKELRHNTSMSEGNSNQDLIFKFYSEFPSPDGNASNVSVLITNLTSGSINKEPETTYDETGYDAIFCEPDRIIALVFGLVAILLNLLTLAALAKTKGRITTHFRLMISLAVSDMLIGATIIAHHVSQATRPQSACLYVTIKALNTTGLNVCLLNLMGMALDHFVAITQPLHYPHLLNKRRSTVLIIILWITALLGGFSDFFSGASVYAKWQNKYSFCEVVNVTQYSEEFTTFAIAILAAFVIISVYCRIYHIVRSHKIPGERAHKIDTAGNTGQFNPRGSSYSRARRSNRALKTTLLIVMTFVICWLPLCLFQVALIIQVKKDRMKLFPIQDILMYLDRYLFILLLVNTIADPIIYTVRLAEVQLGYRRLILSVFKCKVIRNKLSYLEDKGESELKYRGMQYNMENFRGGSKPSKASGMLVQTKSSRGGSSLRENKSSSSGESSSKSHSLKYPEDLYK